MIKAINVKEVLNRQFEAEKEQSYKGYAISLLRESFNRVANPNHWKESWTAYVHHSLVNVVLVAVEFFHADTASIHGSRQLDGWILMSGNGYQAW